MHSPLHTRTQRLAASIVMGLTILTGSLCRSGQAEQLVTDSPDIHSQTQVTDIPSHVLPAELATDEADHGEELTEMGLPTPEGVEKYRRKLEDRLAERYNNLPEYAGRVARVRVVLSKPLDISMDGSLIRAEFDQLAYDNWGKRMPDLEKEYYIVTFGSGGVKQVRSDPSIRIGLDLEKTYSEKAPLIADPFRNVETQEAFRPAPQGKMPNWWRPEISNND